MARHITWELFYNDYIEPCVPAKFKLNGTPSVVFYVADKSQRIGVKIYVDEQHTRLPYMLLKELTLELKADNDGFYVDFSTMNKALFEHFYYMMCFISDSVQIKSTNIVDAINQAVEHIKTLVSSKELLSDDKIVGIWGELWVLEGLINEVGSKAVFFWKGADKAIHDYRFGGIELEVKTTRNEDRVHVISRLSQLEASPEMDLYMCSIQLVEGATEGISLGDYVENINELLVGDSEAITYFNKQLNKEGFNLQQSRLYPSSYYLRSKPSLILITEEFPRIVRNIIDERYGKESSSRISNVHYSVDVTSMGIELTDQEVKRLLGKEK